MYVRRQLAQQYDSAKAGSWQSRGGHRPFLPQPFVPHLPSPSAKNNSRRQSGRRRHAFGDKERETAPPGWRHQAEETEAREGRKRERGVAGERNERNYKGAGTSKEGGGGGPGEGFVPVAD